MKKSFSNWHLWFIWLLFIVTAAIVFYRSASLSMTHDESATWLYLQDNSILPILFLKDAWGTANNHYLNSLLIQWFSSILGDKEWVIRLPNTISYLLYGIASIYLIKRVFETKGAQLMAAGLIFLNVYLIDFFSLARGYGMSLAFHMVALVILYKWIKSRKPFLLVFLFAALTLAALSLFTHLIFFPLYTILVYCFLIWSYKRNAIPFQVSEIIIPLSFLILISLIVYVPVTTLSSNAEFLWGTPMLEESFKGLIKDSLQARAYLGSETDGIIGVILALSIIAGVLQRLKLLQKNDTATAFHLGIFLVFILMIFGIVFSKWIFGTLYPVDRKSTLYLPLIFLLVPYSIEFFKNNKVTTLIGAGFLILSLIHFQDKLEIDRTREWYYDYQTREYIELIASEIKDKDVDVGMNWTFYWSATYYRITESYVHLNLIRYPDKPDILPNHDFLIIHHHEYPFYVSKYEILQGPNKSQVTLLKKID